MYLNSIACKSPNTLLKNASNSSNKPIIDEGSYSLSKSKLPLLENIKSTEVGISDEYSAGFKELCCSALSILPSFVNLGLFIPEIIPLSGKFLKGSAP